MKIGRVMLRFLLMTMLFFVMAVPSYPAEGDMNNNVTPYGDYCRACTIYGTCKEIIAIKEAVMALDLYYRHKGYRLGTIYHKGRFIEAEIFKNSRQVDKVLFDRKTGRLRSIY